MSSYVAIGDKTTFELLQLISNDIHYIGINGFFKKAIFLTSLFFFFLSTCNRALFWTGPISSLAKYKLFCSVSVLSDAILTFYFLFLKKDKIVNVINVCCCCLIL